MSVKVFIASSVEGLEIADAIQENLEHEADATVWNQGVYEPSDQVVQSLLTVLESADFGIFVFSPDDITKLRQAEFQTVRDNVVLELGLFVGRLGLERNFIVTPRTGPRVRMPTDLLGIVTAQYDSARLDDNPPAALGSACAKIRRKMRRLGPAARPSMGLTEDDDETRPEDSSRERLWSRSMPHLDLAPKETVTKLRGVLERIRQRTSDRVGKFGKRVTTSEIRVHIVLPDYSRCEKLGTYQLFLPEDLRVGNHTLDKELRVWPGQGVAGRVFVEPVSWKAVLTVGSDGTLIFPEECEYTNIYRQCVPPDLRWLVAIPLYVPSTDKDPETMGVLGIQGLRHQLTEDQIDAVVGYSMADVLLVAAFIGRVSRVRVTVMMEEPQNDE